MKICSQCGFGNVDNARKCGNCGIDLQWARVNLGKFKGTPSDTARFRMQEVTDSQKETIDNQSQYPALGLVGTIYGIAGWLVLVGGVLLGVFGAFTAYNATGSLFVALVGFIGLPLSGAVIALPMLATKDIVAWMLDMGLNIRESSRSIHELVEAQGRLNSSAQLSNADPQQTPAVRLNNLKELLRTGLITDEEYRNKREEVLHKI